MEVRIEFGHKLIISLYVLVDVPARILLATMYYFIFFFFVRMNGKTFFRIENFEVVTRRATEKI